MTTNKNGAKLMRLKRKIKQISHDRGSKIGKLIGILFVLVPNSYNNATRNMDSITNMFESRLKIM